MEKRKVFQSDISIGTYQQFITEIFLLVHYKLPAFVCFANVHMVVEAYKDAAFQKILNNASIVAPDGKPISLFLSYLESRTQERVCGMDILPDLLEKAETLNKSVFFLGGTNELLSTVVQKTKENYPILTIAGYYSPPFKNLTEEENEYTNTIIKEASPDLVFVSLGCPKQEKWMANNSEKLNTCLLGVGQAFNTYAGVEKRLPKWMRNLSLEWLYRLYLEPNRLWKRYLFTNTYFLVLVLNEIVHRLFRSSQTPNLKETKVVPLKYKVKNGKSMHL
jgi:N-acetylglucosaminyldiphosphoundecaprenol N-acetyl-beta-D-mannosaminyltransferase